MKAVLPVTKDECSRWEGSEKSKAELRREIKLRQRAVYESSRAEISRAICENVLSLPEYRDAGTVFCFVSTAHEPDTDGIILDAISRGKRVCVPKIIGEGIMEAVEIHSLDDLVPGKFGIREPAELSGLVYITSIDLALIPCMSCNKRGKRLGRGGGYYDRFLSRFCKSAAVLCPEELMCGDIPTEPHDLSVPIVITDKNIYRH